MFHKSSYFLPLCKPDPSLKTWLSASLRSPFWPSTSMIARFGRSCVRVTALGVLLIRWIWQGESLDLVSNSDDDDDDDDDNKDEKRKSTCMWFLKRVGCPRVIQDIAQKYNVMCMPTFVGFNSNGGYVDRIEGAIPEKLFDLVKQVCAHLSVYT